jgi:ABC-type spermidine/putrescine transport system permease subunit II
LIFLLSSPLVWLHYFVLALPLGVLLVGGRSTPVRWMALIALTMLGADVWERLLSIRTPAGEALLLGVGAVLLFAASIVDLARETESA